MVQHGGNLNADTMKIIARIIRIYLVKQVDLVAQLIRGAY